MDKSLLELCENFRKGLVNRREFAKKVILTTGGLAAASHFLSSMGFDTGLIEEARAQQDDIVVEEGTYPSGGADISYYLAKPNGGGPFASMIVIHEIFGLSDFIKDVVRLFARTGYLAMAPCLPEGGCQPPGCKHSEWMLETLKTGAAIPAQSEIDELTDGYNFLEGRKDVDSQHIGSVGFCWGGARSFTLATRIDRLWAAVVFYGSTPPFEDLPNIKAPVLALYGALDNASPTSITGRAAETARAMREAQKTFEWEVYNLAPHAFFRDGSMVSTSRPATIAWELVKDFLNRYYERT
jgi:carboxymethylenebutenolidase